MANGKGVSLDVVNARLNDHLNECADRYKETREAIRDLRTTILRAAAATLAALFWIIYEILHAKGVL